MTIRRRLALFALALLSCHTAAAGDAMKLIGLAAEVNVEIDSHGVPHVFANNWTDAARVLGYLHAGDRLWQMDMFRRRRFGHFGRSRGAGRFGKRHHDAPAGYAAHVRSPLEVGRHSR